MSRNLQIFESEIPLYPVKHPQTEITKVRTLETENSEISDVRALKIKKHFERVKRSLRKRSHGIL